MKMYIVKNLSKGKFQLVKEIELDRRDMIKLLHEYRALNDGNRYAVVSTLNVVS